MSTKKLIENHHKFSLPRLCPHLNTSICLFRLGVNCVGGFCICWTVRKAGHGHLPVLESWSPLACAANKLQCIWIYWQQASFIGMLVGGGFGFICGFYTNNIKFLLPSSNLERYSLKFFLPSSVNIFFQSSHQQLVLHPHAPALVLEVQ